MIINGKKITSFLEKEIKKSVKKFKKNKPKLTVFLVGKSAEQLSFVKIKNKLAKKLGINFEFIHYKNTPLFEPFVRKLKEIAENPEITGIIIQQPLPATLSTETIYDYIPKEKEIEGHHQKSLFLPPIGLSVLTVIKSIFFGGKINSKIIVDKKKDLNFFHPKVKE